MTCESTRERKGRVRIEFRGGLAGKICGKCLTWKPLTDFSKGSACGGRNSSCRKCKAVYKQKWDLENKEKAKEYYQHHKEQRNEQSRRWKELNPERNRELKKQWAHENRERRRLYDHKRLARQRGLPDDLSDEQMSEIINYFGGCALTGEDWTWDHVIPISSGYGGTIVENIIPLRSDLNSSKNNRNIFEWFSENKKRLNLSQTKFNELIDYLAKVNDMTVQEYRDYVYWCHAHPRDLAS